MANEFRRPKADPGEFEGVRPLNQYSAKRLTNQTKNRKKYINPLVEEGLLKLTIPDKPNDPNQKYVKV